MKKSLLLIAMCLSALGTYAQDDDVYFVPSHEDTSASNDTPDTYTSGRSSYAPITDDETFQSSNWAANRGTCGRDIDEYNRRGRNYKQQLPDTLDAQASYNQGYDDGYEDGSCTARIVRFWSPRAGVYVSSPYYLDYFDLIDYDPWYYGYGSPCSWGWSGWYGWGSWYGWRPYYASWGWGWDFGWHDPFFWHGYGHGWGWHHPDFAWHPSHNFLPSNAQRGAVGGWTARGGARGVGPVNNRGIAGRGTTGFSQRSQARSGNAWNGFFNRSGRNAQNANGVIRNSRTNVNNSSNGRNFFNRSNKSSSSPARSTQSNRSNDNNRSYNTSAPSRSSFGNSGGFGGGSRGGFGGGSRGGSRGGGRGR